MEALFKGPSPAAMAYMRAVAEETVREKVMVDTLKGLVKTGTVRDKLRASHYQLSSSISPLAFAAHQAGR
ncbi:hypothetical protein P9272_13775 [Mesorhizobium sp. WSM4976]|uniref:hypothetical protein n=1 Tax=Mesorhizobium sp. WSM4976 TaxID=3038549 RepID=UPI0024171259|nr:hypothetical protein [Mesorhizobium sp. WSM4976]MDG4894642.1 hypothetical protein [Mesorhizobium sp. WSM4976]